MSTKKIKPNIFFLCSILALLCAAIVSLLCSIPTVSAQERKNNNTFAGTTNYYHKHDNDDNQTGTDYNESLFSETGINLYFDSQNESNYIGNSIKINSNEFIIDFTNGVVSYPISGVLLSDYMDLEYHFEIINSSSEIVWFAEYIGYCITNHYNDEAITLYGHTININGKIIDYPQTDSINNIRLNLEQFGSPSAMLSDGLYTIKIRRKYNWEQLNSDNISTSQFNSTSLLQGSLHIDTLAPSLTLRGNLTNEEVLPDAYVNERVQVLVQDENFKKLYYKIPSLPNYTSTMSKTFTIPDIPGRYYVYAEDSCGNKSKTISFYYDAQAPIGNIYSNGNIVSSGSYIKNNFSYSANDDLSGIEDYYFKTPTSGIYQKYSPGMIITTNSGDGWYYFYCIDKSNNISEVSSVYLETTAPLVGIYRNGDLEYTQTVASAGTYETNLYFNVGDSFRLTCDTSSGNITSNYTLDTDIKITNDFSINLEIRINSAAGINATFNAHIVKELPKLVIGDMTYDDKTLHFDTDKTISWTYDRIIANPLNSGVSVTSSGNKNIDDFIPHSSGIESFELTTDAGTETIYHIAITDAASNVSGYTVVIDKKAPGGVIKSGGKTVENGRFTNKPACVEFDEDGLTAQYSVNGGEYKPYTSGQLFTADATYVVLLTDPANNKSLYTVTVDTVAPRGQLYADYSLIENGAITNKKIYFSWDGDISATVNGVPYAKNTVLSDDAEYTFVLTDFAGNCSTYRITVDTVSPSYNADKLSGDASYKISKWYVATIGGADYSFATYAEALTFASGREFESGVTVLNLDSVKDFTQSHLVASNGDSNNHADEVRTGEYWLYRSKANPNIKLYYFDRELLNEVLAYYAKENVSGVNYYVLDGDNLYGAPSDSMRDNVLTASDGTLAPAGNGFVFEKADSAVIYAELVGGEGTRSKVTFGTPFGQQFFVNGLYKITEIDEAKNEAVYYLYLDLRAPELKVSATIYGNSEPTELTITKDSLAGIAAYYYESFDVRSITDEDKWSVLTVKSNGNTNYYTFGDELPLLNVGGEYLLSLYDRFGNTYSFTVYIVGNAAAITFENNDDDTAFTLTITLEQDFDTIVALEIWRNGVLLPNVTTEALAYTFDRAGIYTVTLRDNFGRVIEREYTFVKALPVGTLAGVENGGKTKTDVTLIYDEKKYYAVVYKDGAEFLTDKSGSVIILANDGNSGDYMIRLINLTDEENHTEYQFTLNTLAPYVALSGVNNGRTTNGDVTVSWTADDVVSAVYTLNGSEAQLLTSGQILTAEGSYIVTVTNDLGTVTTLNFTIDRTLDYTLAVGDEAVSSVDATNKSVAIFNNEPLHISVTKNGEPMDYAFGAALTDEGVYSIRIFDDYGNAVNFNVIIDKSVACSTNVVNGLISNGGVQFTNGEKLTVTVTRNNNIIDYAFGQTLDEEGLYTVTLHDVYGNEKTISFRIVKSVKQAIDYTLGDGATVISITKNGEPYAANGNRLKFAEDGVYVVTAAVEGVTYTFSLTIDTTAPTVNLNGVENGGMEDGIVTITEPSEPVTVEVYKNDERIDYELGQELSEYANYRVVVTDSAGNITEYHFTLKHLLNGGAVALIVIGILAIIGAALATVILRKKGVFGKKKPLKKDLSEPSDTDSKKG